jgi:hypothetical protein
VRIENPATSLGLLSLLANIRTQLGFAADVPLQVKLKSVRVWGPLVGFNAGPLLPLSVAIQDPYAENIVVSGNISFATRTLEQYTRYPDQVNRACIGYEYSLAHQSLALGGSTAAASGDVVLLQISGAGPGAVVYYYVLFRSGVNAPSNLAGYKEPVEMDNGSSSDDDEIEILSARRVKVRK